MAGKGVQRRDNVYLKEIAQPVGKQAGEEDQAQRQRRDKAGRPCVPLQTLFFAPARRRIQPRQRVQQEQAQHAAGEIDQHLPEEPRRGERSGNAGHVSSPSREAEIGQCQRRAVNGQFEIVDKRQQKPDSGDGGPGNPQPPRQRANQGSDSGVKQNC